MGDAADPVRDPRKTFIVPGIRAFDHYDFSRAKTVCSLSWLVAKAFGTDHVPEELVEPFYTDQYDQEHIKPPVVNLLLSAELYCRAGSLILKSDAAKPLLGHDAVVQALAQKGLYVTEQEKLVTERDLRKKPIQMAAHVAMIDTLMMAYTVEMISIEKVVSCIQQFTNFFPATDLPYDIEDAIMCWINKVNGHLKEIINQEQRSQASEPPGGQRSPTKWYWKLVPARYRKDQALPKQLPCIPSVENLLKDTTDGCTLTALIHFYCPDVIRMEDICLKETMSLADGLYNLQLIQDFCQGYLNQCCHFTLEDMLYASSSIKNNYLVFMAELFWWFEVVKPPFVQPRVVCEVEAEPVQPIRNITAAFPISNATRRSFTDTSPSSAFSSSKVSPTFSPSQPLLPLRHTQQRPHSSGTGMMRRSTSLSYVEGYAGTWPEKKPRSSPQAVAFCIPFDSENNLDISTPNNRPIIRSISNDSLVSNLNNTPKRLMRNSSFQPINGQNDGIEEEMHLPNHTDKSPKSSTKRHGLGNPRRRSMHDTVLNGPIENISDLDDYSNNIGPPSIEEALQIIHDVDKSSDLQSEQLTDGFFLHLKNSSDMPVKPKMNQASSLDSIAEIKGIVSPMTDNTEVDTGIHVPSEDIQETMDEDSSLRDYTVSMDSDLEDPSKPHDTDITNSNYKCLPTPLANSLSTALHVGNAISPGSAIKMTSFAEQKFRKLNHTDPRLSGSSSQKTTPESSELNTPGVVSWGQTPELSPLRQTRDTAQLLASEMVQLKMKLEEKRRAIEAQKKKVEAAFTRQRQKMGRTAFLHVVRKKADGICTVKEELGDESEKSSQQKKVSKVEPIDENEELKIEEVGMNCNSADGIKRDLDELHTQGLKSPTTPVDSEKQVSWNLASPSEEAIGEAEIVEYNRLIEKMNTALHALQQEMQRLAQQQEVIMHMREPQQAWVISPPQPSPQKQVRELRSSSRSTGSLSPSLSSSGESPRSTQRSPQILHRKPAYPHVKNSRTTRPSELKITPLNRVLSLPRSVDSLPHLRKFSPSQVQTRSFIFLGDDGEKQSDHHSKQKCEDSTNDKPADIRVTDEQPSHTDKDDGISRVELWFAQMPSVSREASVDFPDSPVKKKEPPNQTPKAGLIEVSLSDLKPSEEETELDETNEGDADREHFEEDQKLCCGFFFKDDQKAEDDIAVKRAALLEKRMRREKEKQVRRQQLEAELEEKKEETRRKAEEERQKKEDERARREFIKQEYLRKKQLKLMQDMDSVIKPRPTTLKLKKARPKSFREDGEHRRTPVRSSEVSSLSLASLNLAETDHTHSGKRTPRTESVEGSVSPSCNASHSGEKDWENGSTTSSVASATEYTGPKLYKEPSAKSNKHIIQNAISHCCLAGRVNENQKNKILAEIEKSEANHFLILFRDPACQFRALYTYSLETEEIVKLAGIGPKGIGKKMIEGLYKYNSDRKQFSNIPAKTISASVDAIIIHGHLWQNKRPGTPKKLTPSKS
ncbi:calmodulin-regulated spectrin-associated protein 2a isoform X3 [Callorhinchus milii]|uniref:calmodulin-regulated spectrin-associated protein 2a isoform X3 n=1 Tax=Callorhinchus milii TaxID=7868 RepID=UPI00045725CA|nr:calmodulin-regulated spectrin-associated protein 2a isoform X3 [Callorhinchus milii]|eukprot:gi/632940783/ref/XP_007885501.1/ PREDICTED: calmodulin-regulated spectrin-associated protein 2 isoform X3 [Callorhinchus milii]